MEWESRITINPKVLAGKPIVRGSRLAVAFVVDLLAQGWTQDDILENYPSLESADIYACLAYASRVLNTETVYPLALAG